METSAEQIRESFRPADGVGLMGLSRKILTEMFVDDPADPAQNVMGGTRYLRWTANQLRGDMSDTVAAYFTSVEAVKKHRRGASDPRAREFVRRMLAYYRELKQQ